MFLVNESTAAAICLAFHEKGEWPAMVELRRHFPGLDSNEVALRCVRMIAGWQVPTDGCPVG